MKRFMNKKVAAIGLAAGLALGVAGAAFAYFSGSGAGTGSAQTGSVTTTDLAITSTTPTGLLPGGPVGNITLTITNNGTGLSTSARLPAPLRVSPVARLWATRPARRASTRWLRSS